MSDSVTFLDNHPQVRRTDTPGPCLADTQHATHLLDPVGVGKKCSERGTWVIRSCLHLYCTQHAEVIVRAKDELWGGRTTWLR